MNTVSRGGLRSSAGAAWERPAPLPSEQRCARPLLSAPLVLSQSLATQLKARLMTPDSEEARKIIYQDTQRQTAGGISHLGRVES